MPGVSTKKKTMNEFTTEVLPDGAKITKLPDNETLYAIEELGNRVILTKQDIARMYGIAYPTKRLSEKCCNVPQQSDVPDTNVGDIPQTATGDKYEAHVREVATEMAKEAHGYAFETSPPHVQDMDIQYYIGPACIAVRREAEAVKQLSYDIQKSGTICIVTDTYLIDRGLIPAKERR